MLAKLSDVVEAVNEFTDLKVEWETKSQAQQELKHWYADISKIKSTGWEPKYDLKKGLEETYKWLSSNIEFYKNGQID